MTARATSLRRLAFVLILTCCEITLRALAKVIDRDKDDR